eukprot:2298512-Pleurochrysis_carterae.AAC.2
MTVDRSRGAVEVVAASPTSRVLTDGSRLCAQAKARPALERAASFLLSAQMDDGATQPPPFGSAHAHLCGCPCRFASRL